MELGGDQGGSGPPGLKRGGNIYIYIYYNFIFELFISKNLGPYLTILHWFYCNSIWQPQNTLTSICLLLCKNAFVLLQQCKFTQLL